ncbi:BREX-1 system adenine-specific DNA-methyltransferase PglX [Fusobacterium sp. SB021]|uniref:BREX-1 system adenine-specific DNA-methyltransferase PglX n=1 Tax=Fusobacterium sp. SB021 TaxID=2744227 RepID=UPI003CE72F0E
MDKGSLKVFAAESRRDLLEKISNKLKSLGITADGIEKDKIKDMGKDVEINGILYPKTSYNILCRKYKELGYEQLLEESAYTWFNRLVAFAYMEANNYIDERIVFNSGDKIEPEIIDNYYDFDFFQNLSEEKQEEINNLKEKNTPDSLETLYSILVEEKCHALSEIMPFMFEKRGGYSDILFPEGLLMKESFLEKLREEFRKAKGKDEEIIPVEIIGWLYQYYNQDKREVIYDGSMKKSKINKEYIAPATQLFTPHWIVKYMAENSLGKIALESCGVSENLKNNWKYFIENEVSENSERLKIEDIKIIDPAMGSGHMLTYCFDMLSEIYEDLGWSKKEAVFSILKNNLYGLEIDKRASQLASFAVFMKAREKFSRLFKVIERMEEEEKISLNTLCIEESNEISEGTRKLIKENLLINFEKLLDEFYDAKEYGSILKIEYMDIEHLYRELKVLRETYFKQGQMSLIYDNISEEDFEKDCEIIERLIIQQKIMTDRYDVVITNPPYMGNVRMNSKLKEYIDKNYPEVKSDLFSVFIKKTYFLTKTKGLTALVTPYVWWFIKSYEELRNFVLKNTKIDSLIQLEYNAFEGACIPVGTFILRKETSKNYRTECIKLSDFKGIENQPIKTLEAIENPQCGWRYKADQKEFEKISGSPIAYWVSDKVREIFEKGKKLENISKVRKGMDTGNNELFMRVWSEVEKIKIGLNVKDEETVLKNKIKWIPYNKGGSFKKWYGNQEYVLNWENNGAALKKFKNSNLRSKELYFKESLSWTLLSSSNFGLRYYPEGFIFDSNGSSIFFDQNTELLYIEGILLSKIAFKLLQILSSTMAFNIGDLAKFPIYNTSEVNKNKIKIFVQQNINIAKEEWDSRETSWDFEKLFIAKGNKIETAYNDYCSYWTEKFMQMHQNEEELNKIFIDIYELNDEMDEKVPLEDITLLKKETKIENGKLIFNKEEIIKQFLSYAVGCIMGRYSIDKAGLIMANSDDVLENKNSEILVKDRDGNIRHEIKNPRFFPEEFGIIPITSENVFENDIVTKVFEFIKALYGEENFEENIRFICEALGKKESDSYDDVLRNYFIKDFYTDHLQRYQKRPIYWFMNSGKKNGFSALIYLHRYEDMTVARIRTEYLIPYQEKMENLRNYYEKITEDKDTAPKDKKAAEKKLKELYAVLKELQEYGNEVKHISELKISLDLDDGVKVNYEKFGKILKKI